MTWKELIDYIFDEYSVEPDYPFQRDDVTCVFRHIDNRKWFGIAMVIPYWTIGINRDGGVDILNMKCDPLMMGSLRGKPGFRPACWSYSGMIRNSSLACHRIARYTVTQTEYE